MNESDPLTGLDEVPWQHLHHAYGPAEDVPRQLLALGSHDAEERSRALRTLFGNVYHQGSRWEVSAAVVPFLVALVSERATPDRVAILELLTAIAVGDRRDEDLPFDPDTAFLGARRAGEGRALLLERFYGEEELTDDEMELLEAEGVAWEADSYWAAAGSVPAIVSWLGDADDSVAAHAAALLASFRATADVVAALIAVPDERTQARASANLTLAHLPDADPVIDGRLRQSLAAAEDEVVLTAAVALAYRGAGGEVVRTLSGSKDRELPVGVAGWDRALRGFVTLALRRLGGA